MKKLGKKGEVISVDGLTLQIEKAGENNAVCSVVSDGDQQSYHLARRDGQIAAGKTERSAQLALRRKLFQSKTEEQRITDFVKRYPPNEMHTVEEWMEIHQELTGSCCMGGYRFIRSRGLNRYDKYSTLEFLQIVDGAYGGEIIQKIKQHFKEE